ncbi:hypothetical protein MASR2M117_12280 [Paludibacter sp.]
MATITLRYDGRNIIAKKTINYILSLGVFEKKTELDEAIEDKKMGRVYKAKNAKDLINQCTR